MSFPIINEMEWERSRLTVNKECNVGEPCARRNRHSNSVPIPNGDST